MKKLLIATTNKGKFEEIKKFFDSMPFILCVSLDELDQNVPEPEETEPTIEGNAFLKAKYYAEKTGLLSLADDGGIFIDALDGWPGVKSARAADTDEKCRALALKKLADISTNNKNAHFRLALSLYDPKTKNSYMALGECAGKIVDERGPTSWGYNQIFYLPELYKTYAELTPQEKNETSHRGRALIKMKYILQNQYGSRHIVVPFSLVIKENKILMILRNDPHRPDYHKKWEFPGGSVEFGEQLEENVIRETKEETGYDVKVISRLNHILVEFQTYPTFSYQIYLLPYVCKIVGGKGVPSDDEALDMQWFELDDVLNHELIGENAKIYETVLEDLKKVVSNQ